MHDQKFLILMWALGLLCKSDLQLSQQTSNSVPFSFSGTSRGPSPVTLASQDALPIAVAFTESVNAYFKGADPTKWVSHDLLLLQDPDLDLRSYRHCFYLKLNNNMFKLVLWVIQYTVVYAVVPSQMCSTHSVSLWTCVLLSVISRWLCMCGMFCISLTPFFQSG